MQEKQKEEVFYKDFSYNNHKMKKNNKKAEKRT